jgi:O-antigen ligase
MADARTQNLLRQIETEVRRTAPPPATFQLKTFARTQRRGEIIDGAVFSVFVAGLAWVPYWYGSNLLEAWGINAVLFPALAVIYEISLLARGANHPVAIKTVRVSAALFVAVVIWILIQNATWTPAFLHHPIWGMAADTLQTSVEGSISVDRDHTTLALLRLVTAASVLWLAIQLCRNESRANQLMLAFVAISSCYAVYGLIAFMQVQPVNSSARIFVTSTFYNNNHYATYAGMSLVAAFGLIASIYENGMAADEWTLRSRIAAFIEDTGRASVMLGCAFLILVAVILTASRGGIIATGLGVIVWAALSFGRTQGYWIARLIIMALGSVVVVGIVGAFGDTLFGKVAEFGLADSDRSDVYIVTLRSILDEPLLGYGYGTFADIFPMFRDRSIDLQRTWDQAHNTYLEVFQGLGLIFGSMLVASVVLLVWKCCKGAMVRQQITVPCIATGIAFLVSVHAMVDFSLQIQAVTLTFMAILGAGVAQSMSSQLALND